MTGLHVPTCSGESERGSQGASVQRGFSVGYGVLWVGSVQGLGVSVRVRVSGVNQCSVVATEVLSGGQENSMETKFRVY